MSSFTAGESDADSPTPPITREVMGPRCGIRVTQAQSGRGDHQQLVEPYLMPPYHGRNGSNERAAPGITLTPLGGMMPGPNAIAPAVMGGHVGAFPVSEGEFGQGVSDSYPEGCPVPIR